MAKGEGAPREAVCRWHLQLRAPFSWPELGDSLSQMWPCRLLPSQQLRSSVALSAFVSKRRNSCYLRWENAVPYRRNPGKAVDPRHGEPCLVSPSGRGEVTWPAVLCSYSVCHARKVSIKFLWKNPLRAGCSLPTCMRPRVWSQHRKQRKTHLCGKKRAMCKMSPNSLFVLWLL